LNAALASCPSGDVVLLASGTYAVNGTLTVPSNCTLRGAGPTATILNATGTSGAVISMGQNGPYAPQSVTITSGATAGSTSLTLSSVANITAPGGGFAATPGYLRISELNDPVYVSIDTDINTAATDCDVSMFSGARCRQQMVEITGISGSTVTINPPLFTNYGSATGTSPAYASPSLDSNNHAAPSGAWIGVENLQIYANNTGYAQTFSMVMCAYCWVKNVFDNYTDGDHIDNYFGFRDEIRDSYFSNAMGHSSGGSDADVSLLSTSGTLIENNILERLHAGNLVDNGSSGNVIAYNYEIGNFDSSGDLVILSAFGQHYAHPQFNLYEGNVGNNLTVDSFWGTGSNNTRFRNQLRGTDTLASPLSNGRNTVNWSSTQLVNEQMFADTIAYPHTNENEIANVLGSADAVTAATSGKYNSGSSPYTSTVIPSATRNYSDWFYATSVGYDTGSDSTGGVAPYTTGTVTSISGTAVTGSGTGWTSALNGLNFWCNNQTGVGPITVTVNTATTLTLASSGPSTCSAYTIGSGPESFPAGPSNVAGYWVGLASGTLFQHGNFDIASNSVIWASSVTHALPASFFLSSQPSWWHTAYGTPPWPAIGPDVTGGNVDNSTLGGHVNQIPAELCYNGLSRDATGIKIFSGNCYGVSSTPIAYDGVNVIQWGTIPNFGGATNNYATGYDDSFLTGCSGPCTNFDGTPFSNSANLAPITRLTESTSVCGPANSSLQAGEGDSATFFLFNTATTLIAIGGSGGARCMGVLNQPGYAGQLLPYSAFSNTGGLQPSAGNFITRNMCVSGCSAGSSSAYNDFGAGNYGLSDSPTGSIFTWYAWGNNSYDISTPMTVCPYSINMAAGSVGLYTLDPCLANFQFGLPANNNTSDWAASTSYAYGAYITHVLTSAEMATGGVWTASTNYKVGDITTGSGTAASCMYRAESITGSGTSGSSIPAFHTTPQSACRDDAIVDNQVTWRGTNSYAQFLYQNTGTLGTSGTGTKVFVPTPATLCPSGSITSGSQTLSCSTSSFAASNVGNAILVGTSFYTTITGYTNATTVTVAIEAPSTLSSVAVALTGHPDLMSGVPDANGIQWTNVGPAYVPQNVNQLYFDNGRQSRDAACGGYACKFAAGASTNSYGAATGALEGLDYAQATDDQGTGQWVFVADESALIYHTLNLFTGIWTDYAVTGGTMLSPTGTTTTTVGGLTGIEGCPAGLHNNKLNATGVYNDITAEYFYTACGGSAYYLWNSITADYNAGTSLAVLLGENHWDLANTTLTAFTNNAFCNTSDNGIFMTIISLASPTLITTPCASTNALTSSFLLPFGNNTSGQTTPPGCYISINPWCDAQTTLDNHVSTAASSYLGSDTMPACGSTYNYATLSPIAFTAYQGMLTCWPVTPTQGVSYIATGPSFGPVSQYTHCFNTGTSIFFAGQFCISHLSLKGDALAFTSDWNCSNGSTTGSAPTVWSSGTYYQKYAITAVYGAPAYGNSSSLCGLPWQPSTAYTAGQLFNPIEGTSGSGQIDDVFQVLTSGTTGPNSSLSSKQPKCGSVSCFASTNPPTVTPIAVTSCVEVATTATCVVASAMPLNQGVFVTLAGTSVTGYDGTWPANASSGTMITLTGLPSTLGASTGGTAAAQGDTVCDLTTPGSDSLNPSLPYSSSCSPGVVSQDLGEQNQRSDVYYVGLSTPTIASGAPPGPFVIQISQLYGEGRGVFRAAAGQ
jgi:hypothetical protein